ncbi:MAG: biotin--[acetyl-CoA-carboxylase] ligase [Thermoplasmata archaeon]
MARGGAPEGTRVVARRQAGGRGRLDHRWLSPPGGLYLSIVLGAPPSASTLLPLALGAGLLSSFRDRYGVPGALKWPNDLIVAPPGGPVRKLGGILADRVAVPAAGDSVIAGIGINVLPSEVPVPPELEGRIAYLAEFVTPPPLRRSVEDLVADVAIGVARSLRTSDGAAAALRLCRELLYGVGRTAHADEGIRGRIVGLGEEGELLLEAGTGRVAIRAGDLRVEDDP